MTLATPLEIELMAVAGLVESASAPLAIPRSRAGNTPAGSSKSMAWAFCGVMRASTS
jgi:hypothetical protein